MTDNEKKLTEIISLLLHTLVVSDKDECSGMVFSIEDRGILKNIQDKLAEIK